MHIFLLLASVSASLRSPTALNALASDRLGQVDKRLGLASVSGQNASVSASASARKVSCTSLINGDGDGDDDDDDDDTDRQK